jgi:DNA repair protein SbcC/Rad50
MKRLDKLHIENFQSHESTEIVFSEGLNVFVGPSDSGKSAILRALKWVLYNQPRGSEFIRTGASRCRVTLTLSDGVEIIRERSSSVNRYILRQPDGSEQVYEGFGGNVPEEILEAHGMHPLRLDQDWHIPAQFGTQLEGPFLLSETGGARAKSIGRVSGAHIMDIALKETVRDRQRVSSKIKHREEDLEQVQEALKPYENLAELMQRLEETKGLHASASRRQERLERLQRLRELWFQCRRDKQVIEEKLSALSQLERGEQLLIGIERNQDQRRRLLRLQEKWQRFKDERGQWQQVQEQTRHCKEAEDRVQVSEDVQRLLLRLWKAKKTWRDCQAQITRLKEIREQMEVLPQAEACLVSMEDRLSRYQRLQAALPRWKQVSRGMTETKRWLKQTDHLVDAAAVMEHTEEKLSRLQTLAARAGKLRELRQRLSDGRAYKKDREQEVERLTQELVAEYRKLDKCPTCGSAIHADLLEHVMEEYLGGITHAAAGRED